MMILELMNGSRVSPPRRVSPREAQRLVDAEGYRMVDVRTPLEFALGHPRDSVNEPWGGGEAPFVAAVERRFDRDARLVLSCEAGVRSLYAAIALVDAGFTNVVDQRAGMAGSRGPFGQLVERGWVAEGLPVDVARGERDD